MTVLPSDLRFWGRTGGGRLSSPSTTSEHPTWENERGRRPHAMSHEIPTTRIRERRDSAEGNRVWRVMCPYCHRRHWIAPGPIAQCSRGGGIFRIVGAK